MLETKQGDCDCINDYNYIEFKRGYHILIKDDCRRTVLRLTEEDFLDDNVLEFMTLNNITR